MNKMSDKYSKIENVNKKEKNGVGHLLADKKIREELNVAKWNIWLPSHSPLVKNSEIVFERSIWTDKGMLQCKLTVKKSGKETLLTTKDQKVFLVLQEIVLEKIKQCLFEMGYTREKLLNLEVFEVKTSLTEILKRLGLKPIAENYKFLKRSLMRLRGTLFVWENAFYSGKDKEYYTLLDTFNLLVKLKIGKSKKEGKKANEDKDKFVTIFALNPYIFRNLVLNHTKPTLIDVVLSFKSEIAQKLYTILDLILANKNFDEVYERKTEHLFFIDLKLNNKTYNYPSERKRVLEKAIKELNGKPLSNGGFLEVGLEACNFVSDYKFIARKIEAQSYKNE